MKMLILSDSHGRLERCYDAIERESPDIIVHLGDHTSDADEIKKQSPHIPLRAVRGNCDMLSSYPDTDLFDFCGNTVFITHGHRYSVKLGTDALLNAGHFSGACLVLFGHTHRQSSSIVPDGMQAINPGSIADGYYAVAESACRGAVSCRLMHI